VIWLQRHPLIDPIFPKTPAPRYAFSFFENGQGSRVGSVSVPFARENLHLVVLPASSQDPAAKSPLFSF
jgi:hypothetical protein